MVSFPDVLEHRVINDHSTFVNEAVRMATMTVYHVAFKRFLPFRKNLPFFVNSFKEFRVLLFKFS